MTVLKIMVVVLACLIPQQSKGFALLGPRADWMQSSNGFHVGDIGGPMDLGEEYRWNVPLLTYGFDQSFLDYFGSNGVAAVEHAFQILNDLPPVSSMNLENYSTSVFRANLSMELQHSLDLKSITLGLMLEQLGLAQPTRNIFVLRQWIPIFETLPSSFQWPEGVIPANVLERNFDPASLLNSRSVNGSGFMGEAIGYQNNWDIFEMVIDPTDQSLTAVADLEFYNGNFFVGLSADDAGGLRYLLHTNNINRESLLPGVRGVTNQAYVDSARRPGVDKIIFVRQPFDPLIQHWIPHTNQFTDTYWINNQSMEQSLERVIAKPDLLFSVGDTGAGNSMSQLVLRTGTTNWLNNGLDAPGPGVIRPPVQFVFNKLNAVFLTIDGYPEDSFAPNFPRWASFDNSTNVPITYPTDTFVDTNFLTVRLRLRDSLLPQTDQSIDWKLSVPFQGTAILQTSTNLTEWTTVITVTNSGGVVEWNHRRSQSQRFFRAIPE